MTLKCYDSNDNESLVLKSLVLQEMVKKGVFMSPGPTFLSYSHNQNDIEYTLNKFEEVCKEIKNIKEQNYTKYLEGIPPKPIWKMNIPTTKRK